MVHSPRSGSNWVPGVLSLVALGILAWVQVQASGWQTSRELDRLRLQLRSEALATALQVERSILEDQRGFESSLAGVTDLPALEEALARWLDGHPSLPVARIRLEPNRTVGPTLRDVGEPLRWNRGTRSFIPDSPDAPPAQAGDTSGLIPVREDQPPRDQPTTHPLTHRPVTLRTAWTARGGRSWWVSAEIDEDRWTPGLSRSPRTGDVDLEVIVRRRSGGPPSAGDGVVVTLPVSAEAGESALLVMVSPSSGTLSDLALAGTRGTRWAGWIAWTVLAAAVLGLLLAQERSRRLARRQREFIATVSHELRTPLAAVRALGENLAAGLQSDPKRLETYGHEIVAEVDRLRGTAEAALAVARGDHDPPAHMEVDPILEVRNLLADLRLELPIRVRGTPRRVRASAADLRIGVRNLLDNAIRHGGGPDDVEVVVDHDARQGSVTVTVLDRGEGVAGRRPSGIFRAFARDGKKRGPEIDGMGLGLGLTRRLMAQLGGSLILSDREGGGTAATLELPAADGDDDAI